MRFRLVLFFICLSIGATVIAQDTLPRFSAILKSNGKVIISWHNKFQSLTQISIQRSFDSLKNFTSLLTVPDPNVAENGFVDAKAADTKMYYRIFIVFGSGSYIFSKSQRAQSSTPEQVENVEDKEIKSRNEDQRVVYQQNNKSTNALNFSKLNGVSKVEVEKITFVKKGDSVIGQVPGKMLKRFRDSILSKTKDTLAFLDADTILIKSFVPKEVYKISSYVFTSKDGNINISLPDAATKKYSVKFLEIDSSPVFDIKEIKDVLLIVDRTNFVHSGWFRFELYEDGKLKEKNRLFIPKDF
jgi:hypothetical protein